MKVRRRGKQIHVWLDDEPRSALHRPSIDVLMASVARVYGAKVLGVVLTGMGSDGVAGAARHPRGRGAARWPRARRPASSTACPRRPSRRGSWTSVVPLDRMADEILAAV